MNVKITPKSPRRAPKTLKKASWRREHAPTKLGVTGWEVKIAPKSPRRAPRSAPRAPWKPPRVPGRPPRKERRGPREPPNALKTTENVPRTAGTATTLKIRRIMKGLKHLHLRPYIKYS